MTIRCSLLAAYATLTILGGCALQPQVEDNGQSEDLLTTAQLTSQLNALETRLTEQCSAQELAHQEQQSQFERLNTEVRESGSLLLELRADVEKLHSESAIVMPDCPVGRTEALENKELLGRNEWIGFPGVGTYLKARIDSGANTASISAKEITEFEREGESWVRFKLALADDTVVVEEVRDEWIEAEITRQVKIIQASGEENRPVISLLMELGPIKQNVEFTLNDRSHLTYPVLLGRRFMMDIALIDVSQAYLHERPEYPGGAPSERAVEDEATDRNDDQENE